MMSASPLRPSSSPDDVLGGGDALATGQFPAAGEARFVDGPHSGTVLPPPPLNATPVSRGFEENAEDFRWLDDALADDIEVDLDDLERDTPLRGSVSPKSAPRDTAIVPKR